LECWAKAISRYETGSSFKPVHAKASTQDGLNPSHVGLDEIHAHKTADLLNVLTFAAGARVNPLWLYTTTEGYINPGPWGEIRMFAKRLLGGVFIDTADHFLVVFYAVDEENKTLGIKADDEFDESAWIKANPLMDVNPHLLTSIRKEAIEAKQMPSKLAEFRIKRLNRQASTGEGWIDLTKWAECSDPVNLDSLKDMPCYGGLDLASTSDICSFRLVWRVDGKIITHGWRWVPESAVAYRTERGTIPYASWTESGLLMKTPGNVVDYAIIEHGIKEICEKFNIQNIAYDRWNATDLVNRLVDEEIPLIEFIQGPKSYHPAMQELERHYMAGNVAHGGDPVLMWCASNIIARRDANLNMAPDKKNSADKIDDMASLLMAVGISIQAEEKKPEYQMFFM
jgi:phage terminase large subunit-like protein